MKQRHIIQVGLMLLLVSVLSVTAWMKEDEVHSYSERRVLAQFPELSLETIMSGEFMSEFETYAQDQFPMRESFRRLKSQVVYGIFRQKDQHQVYIVDDHASKIEYPLNEEMLDYAADQFEEIYEMYLKECTEEIYFSVIPDKNYFLAEENGYPVMDYEKLFSVMKEKTAYMKWIDITDTLALEDYYFTDTHWRQEKLRGTAEVLAEEMGVTLAMEFQKCEVEEPFYGVYFGQSALPLEPDHISYLTNDVLDSCKVTCLDNGEEEEIALYDMEKAKGNDAYEMFLSGARAVVKIENPTTQSRKELVVFRDSFANCLIPLLVEGYSEIVLIDLRYIDEIKIGEMTDFEGKDVLFLYSTLLLNNSLALK